MASSYLARQREEEAAKLRLEAARLEERVAEEKALRAAAEAEQNRSRAFQAHHELLQKIHTYNFDELLKQITSLSFLDYPRNNVLIPLDSLTSPNKSPPFPCDNNNSCLVDLILTHGQLSHPQRVELIANILNTNPAYTDILLKENIIKFFLDNADYHTLLKKLYFSTCSTRPWLALEKQYEDKIWDLLIQKSGELSEGFQLLFNQINTNNYYMNYHRAKLLRFATYWLNQSTSSEQTISTYNAIKQLFSVCEPLNKYTAPYLHQMADVLVTKFSITEAKSDAGKDSNFDFLDQRYSFFSRCWGLTESQELYNKVKNKEEKSTEALENATQAVESELNRKFQQKYGFTTTLRR